MQISTGNQTTANSLYSYYNQPNSKTTKNHLTSSAFNKAENELIKNLNEQKSLVMANEDLDDKSKKLRIESIQEQIDQILEARMKRELEAIQQAAEEKKKESEPAKEEEEGVISTTDIKAMIDISISNEKITVMKQSRARLAAEQALLGQGMSADAESGYVSDSKANLATKLDSGLSQMDMAIAEEEGNIAKTSRDYTKTKNEEAKNRRANETDETEETAADQTDESKTAKEAVTESVAEAITEAAKEENNSIDVLV